MVNGSLRKGGDTSNNADSSVNLSLELGRRGDRMHSTFNMAIQRRILQSWFPMKWCWILWPPPIRTTIWRSDSGQRQSFVEQNQTGNLSIWSYLAFLQFFSAVQANLALLPYFFGLAYFERIIELGEQDRRFKEFFKIFVKTVPFYLRLFSY